MKSSMKSLSRKPRKMLRNLSAIWQRKAIMPNLKKNNYEDKVFLSKIKGFSVHQ